MCFSRPFYAAWKSSTSYHAATPGWFGKYRCNPHRQKPRTREKEYHWNPATLRRQSFDITWKDEGSAVKAISSGIDIDGSHLDLRLLGFKSLDVSIFVACEFPDKSLKELLRNYGDLNETKIRRLHLKEPGFEHMENGFEL